LKQPRDAELEACEGSNLARLVLSPGGLRLEPLRADLPRHNKRRALALALVACAALSSLARPARAQQQQQNPVDRKVENPITDTPSVSPLSQDQQQTRARPRRPAGTAGEQPSDVLDVHANKETVTGPEKARVVVEEGNVDARIGIYRLQADKVTVYEAKNLVVAEGNVVFDQGQFQRITGSRAEWNYATKTGFFENSTGFTNQTQDGTIIYFTADRVEKVSGTKIVVTNAEITACGDDQVPKWSFKAARATITLADRVRVRKPAFLVKHVPVFWMPYASVSIKPRDRASGFLTPTFSGSGSKGFRFSEAYFQTLGRSADITFRGDIYTARGVGFGADLRTRANSRSYFNMGFYAVKDRIFGPREDAQHPNQGGSSFYADGVHYFPNGFLAAADVNITSNLAFRQVFSDSIQLVISPEETSQVFVNKNFGAYSFNFIARSQVITLPTARIRTREMPSVSVDKRPSLVKWFEEKLPLYFSFESSLSGVSRKETVLDQAGFQAAGSLNPVSTPSIVQRLDMYPHVSIPFDFGGWDVTVSASGRGTFYSNSIDPATRLILPNNLMRTYGEFTLDLRPPALARNFHRRDGSFWFRHVVEPYLTYRKIGGLNNFAHVIRFDETDAVADTSEIEYGVTNRFFFRRSTESVGAKPTTARPGQGARGRGQKPGQEAEKKTEKGGIEIPKNTTVSGSLTVMQTKPPLARQPYEFLSVTVRQKYFFDPTFGGALVPGGRNQFYPINTFSGFSYGGIPRRFSPMNIEARLRMPTVADSQLYADVRTDLDTFGNVNPGLRDLAVSFGIRHRVRAIRSVEAFQTFYYTRAVTLVPSLFRYSDPTGHEPGTLRGSQWSPSFFLGDRSRGWFGGASFFFDFQDRPGKTTSLVSSVATVGRSWDCCAVVMQYFTFNVGLRNEHRFVFSFRLNGIGTFGTEKIGQRF
jgi:LPS-assembly protein